MFGLSKDRLTNKQIEQLAEFFAMSILDSTNEFTTGFEEKFDYDITDKETFALSALIYHSWLFTAAMGVLELPDWKKVTDQVHSRIAEITSISDFALLVKEKYPQYYLVYKNPSIGGRDFGFGKFLAEQFFKERNIAIDVLYYLDKITNVYIQTRQDLIRGVYDAIKK